MREAHRQVLGYFANQVHRMDYPAYRAKGWQIGSGSVESACKQVGHRLKGTGMRWSPEGAEADLTPHEPTSCGNRPVRRATSKIQPRRA